jgi:predicted branched-subunit amino acid permease
VAHPPPNPPPVSFTRAGAWRGARAVLPMLIGTAPFGVVTGIAAQGAGLSLTEATLMSAIVYAGSAQLVALLGWAVPAPVLSATLAALAMNLRMALMGPVLAPWLDRLRGLRLWGTLFFMADQNWALSVREMTSGGSDAAFLLGSGLALWVMWVATTVAGHLLGGWINPPPGHPIFFAAFAVFVALLVDLSRGWGDVLPWLVAAVVAAGTAQAVPGGAWYIVAGAVAGSVAGGLRDHWRA